MPPFIAYMYFSANVFKEGREFTYLTPKKTLRTIFLGGSQEANKKTKMHNFIYFYIIFQPAKVERQSILLLISP